MSYARGAALCAAPKKLIRPARVRGREYTGISRGLLREINKIIRGKVMNKKGFLSLLFAAVSAASLASAISLAACTPAEDKHEHQWSAEWSLDGANHWHECSGCDETQDESAHTWGEWEVTKEATATEAGSRQRECTVCGYTQTETIPATGEGDEPETGFTVTFNTNGGSEIAAVTVEEGGKVTKPADPTNSNTEGAIFAGWYSDAALTTPFDFDSTITADITLYAKWQQQITTAVDFMDLCEANGNTSGSQSFPTDGLSYLGIFTFMGGRTEPNHLCVNTQGAEIVITLTGDTNSITIYGRGASSSSASAALYDSEGNVIPGTETGTLSNNQYFGAETIGDETAGTPIVVEDLPAGTYTFDGSGSLRITTLEVTQLLDIGTPTEIVADSISAPNSDLLIGSEYNPNGVTAQIRYNNGTTQTKTIDVDDIDTSAVDENNAGEYTVTFTYTENGATVTGSYVVKVYAIESVEIGDYLTNGDETTNLKKVYAEGETLDTTALTIIATAKTGDDGETAQFIVPSSYYTTALNTAGTACEITVNGDYLLDRTQTLTASYDIYNIDAADMLSEIENGILEITVDADATVNATTYKTLTDALCAIETAEVPDYVIKRIVVADGEYKEKVFVNIPNVHLVAQNIVDIEDLGAGDENSSNVVFWFDALAGLGDPAGNGHGTNGSASFTISTGAVGFRAEGITFKNYYNTNDLYNSSLALTGDTQAVAVYIDCEQVAFYNCKFTSYHDTLYANRGSHYFEDCWIEGRTDYIFGSTATSYYKNCNIWSIGAGSTSNGGYVCAAQSNANSAFIFDGCNFDGDDNVVDGTASLGRPWGENMKMVVMNSTISEKFSTKMHTDGTSQGERYVTMSGHDPIPANFIEYNNTGAGALVGLTAEQIAAYAENTCTVVTDASAVAQYTVESVFTDWDPTERDLVTVTVASNDGSTIYGTLSLFAGATPNAAILGSFVPDEAIPSGYRLEGLATTANATQPNIEMGAITANVTYYAVITEIPEGAIQTVETVVFDESIVDNRLDNNPIEGEYINITSTGGGNTGIATGTPYVANDGSGLSFNYAYRPTGNNRTLTITANKACTVTYYYTLTDGGWAASSANGLTWEYSTGGTGTTGTIDYEPGVAYAVTFELAEGESVSFTNISDRRLTSFGYVITAIVE